jgi:hypothetical protein
MKKYSFIVLSLFLVELVLAQPSRKVRINSETNINQDLPTNYKQRTFIKGLAGFVNNIDQLVGTLVLIDGEKTNVLTRYVRQEKPPVVTSSTSDIIYNCKVSNTFKANGLYSIASTKVSDNTVSELVITDIGMAFLPEDYIPYMELCRASRNVNAEIKKKMFYIRSAKLTTVYTRMYKKMDGNSDLNGVVFCVKGELFGSTEQFKVDYIVSVDVVSLENLLMLHNCDQIIQNEEIASREQAETTRLAAVQAEENQKSRENMLNAVKSEVGELRKQLADQSSQSSDLKKQLDEALLREKNATLQLQNAQQLATASALQAQQAENSAEKQQKLLVSLKNKNGQETVLELKSLNTSGMEKLKEMGFDVNLLQPSSQKTITTNNGN